MRKKTKIFIGDKIKITKQLPPVELENGEEIEFPVGVEGIIVGRVPDTDQYIVDFGKEEKWTHNCDDILPEHTGLFVSKEYFKVIESISSKSPEKADFVKFFKEKEVEKILKARKEISKNKKLIKDLEENIKNRLRNNRLDEQQIQELSMKIKEAEKQKIENVVFKRFEKMYDKLMSHPKIKKIEIIEMDGEPNLLVTTEELKYHARKEEPEIINNMLLGAFKILIPTNSSRIIRIVNYKLHVKKNYFHPNVKNGELCAGDTAKQEIKKLQQEGNLEAIPLLIISLLEKPNTRDPYLNPTYWYGAQEVTIRPTNPLNWFNMSYWRDREIWDEEAYIQQIKEIFDEEIDGDIL